MNEISAKYIRQIEILGIAIKNTESLGTGELAQMYGVERLTIKRDLQELRNHGIDIHSEGKKGIRLVSRLDAARIQRLVSSYLTLVGVGRSVDRASSLLAKKLGADALNIVVTIQHCIDSLRSIRITYKSERANKDVEYVVNPVQFFQAQGVWRLLAEHDGTVKQFLLMKISAVAPTDSNFRQIPDEKIDELFKYSFNGWTGNDKHKVRLRLSKELAGRLQARQGLFFDDINEQPNGDFVVKGAVNSIEEIARWIVGLGKGIVVEAPKELRSMVLAVAKDAISNY